jgi:hypothetical protein
LVSRDVENEEIHKECVVTISKSTVTRLSRGSDSHIHSIKLHSMTSKCHH